MASPAQIAANQRNSSKSTGPRSPHGRAISSMNSLKHGNRSRKLALLREESCAFEERLRKWMAIGDAQIDVEEYLVYRNVHLSFELDRAERARAERCTSLIENSDEDEVAEAQAIGKQLFFDPAGPTPLYGNPPFFSRKKKTSWNERAFDPSDPAVLVKILERNRAGCYWLREEWQALRAQLESPGFWQSHDRLKAIRLLSRQPVESTRPERAAGGTGPVARGHTQRNRTGQKTDYVKRARGVDRSSRLTICSGREMARTIVSSARTGSIRTGWNSTGVL